MGVLAGDIAVYEAGPARPTGGAGVVALLIGPEAPIVLENRLRSSHFEDVYDFYKPFMSSEYPAVDGHLSNSCYFRALDNCYRRYVQKFADQNGSQFQVGMEHAQHYLFHQPYTKLVQKSFARMYYNDAVLKNELSPEAQAALEPFLELPDEESYTNRDLDKACQQVAETLYKDRCFPYTFAGRNLGNSYTGSLYFGLLSLIAQSEGKVEQGDRMMLFSYGSGLASTMFSAVVDGDLSEQREKCDLLNRLDNRVEVTPEEFSQTLLQREAAYTANDYVNLEPPAHLAPGSYYVSGVDSLGRRTYERTPAMSQTMPASSRVVREQQVYAQEPMAARAFSTSTRSQTGRRMMSTLARNILRRIPK